MRINGNLTNSNVAIYHTTESSSTSTGALLVSGGVGVAKNLNVGGKITSAGAPTASTDVVRLADIGGAVLSGGYLTGEWTWYGSAGGTLNIYYQVQGNLWTVCQKSSATYTPSATVSALTFNQLLPSGYRPTGGVSECIACTVGSTMYTPCILIIGTDGLIYVIKQSTDSFTSGT